MLLTIVALSNRFTEKWRSLWHVRVVLDAEWRFNERGQDPGTTWHTNDYDDGEWPVGRALLAIDNTV